MANGPEHAGKGSVPRSFMLLSLTLSLWSFSSREVDAQVSFTASELLGRPTGVGIAKMRGGTENE